MTLLQLDTTTVHRWLDGNYDKKKLFYIKFDLNFATYEDILIKFTSLCKIFTYLSDYLKLFDAICCIINAWHTAKAGHYLGCPWSHGLWPKKTFS